MQLSFDENMAKAIMAPMPAAEEYDWHLRQASMQTTSGQSPSCRGLQPVQDFFKVWYASDAKFARSSFPLASDGRRTKNAASVTS
jgi:hypothetical protein